MHGVRSRACYLVATMRLGLSGVGSRATQNSMSSPCFSSEVRDVLELGAVEEQVLRPLAGFDEAPALLALAVHLLHLHDALRIAVCTSCHTRTAAECTRQRSHQGELLPQGIARQQL